MLHLQQQARTKKNENEETSRGLREALGFGVRVSQKQEGYGYSNLPGAELKGGVVDGEDADQKVDGERDQQPRTGCDGAPDELQAR